MREKKSERLDCPVCGNKGYSEEIAHECCSICGWEEDGIQLDKPNRRGGANKMSLNEARAAYAKGEEIN